jgi:hypothetical protein
LSARSPLSYVLLGFSILYVVTLFPGVGGTVNHGDSAKFQFIGRVLGLSHPPGNPLYMLLDAAWVRVPLPLRAATKVTLLSSVFGVLTLFYVYRTLERTLGPRAAVAGALALGLGPLFWTFSTEAEVYTLNTCLLAGACYYSAWFAETGEERPFLLGAAFYSLGFANHLTSAMLLPAFLAVTIARLLLGAKLRRRDLLLVPLFVALSAALYLYIPWRFSAGAVYSEFGDTLDRASFWAYVTAKQFQGSFGQVSFLSGVHDRMPALLTVLEKQWMWPMLFVFPTAYVALGARSRLFRAFLGIAVVGLLFFAFEYDIPDPDGFYMPVALLLSLGVGAAMDSFAEKRPRLSWVAFGAFLGIPAAAHLIEWRSEDGCDVVEGMDNETGVVLWDLEDLFEHVPVGARFAVPCSHYGCTEVLNYYRYAEPVVARRHIEFVRFPNSEPDYWDTHTKVEKVEVESARHIPTCSIRKLDYDAFKARRIPFNSEFRPTRTVHQGTVQGASLYCTHNEG